MLEAIRQWDWLIDGWIVAAGALCAVASALLGPFLVLRRMSMMGDAISHAVLPGLALAFIITESRASWPMFIGAAIVGILTALFTEWVRGFGKVDEGASMGVVFTVLFAIGLMLAVRAADHVDLDPSCVLYGAIEWTPFITQDVFNTPDDLSDDVPQVVLTLGAVCGLNLLFVVLFYKELKLSSFDPALAAALGIKPRIMHYLLMTLVAITAVASFETVGNILVVAMLVVPAAAAYLLTDRLSLMLVLAVTLGVMSAAMGHVGAIAVPAAFGFKSTNTSGMMAVASGLLLALAGLLSPRYGALGWALRRRRARHLVEPVALT